MTGGGAGVGRTVLVTGGTRGIGAAITRRFLDGGWKAVVTARSDASFAAFAETLDVEAEARVRFVAADFADPDSVEALVDGVLTPGEVDALVNNAGDNVNNPLPDLRIDDLDRLYRINLATPVRLMQAAAVGMSRRRWGRIVNISSIWSVVTRTGRLAYTASKTGLVGVTRTAAVDLGADGILVNAVSPGFTLTELTRRTLSDADIEELSSKVPLGRFARPAEVAGVVYFLCGDENTYITGQNLVIDGGYTVV